MDNEPVWANPELRPNPFWMRLLKRTNWRGRARLLVLTVPLTAAIGWWASRTNEDCAKGIIENTLGVSPSSAHYISFETLAKEDRWRMERVVFDVGGAPESVCLTYRIEDGQYRWNRNTGVQECNKHPSPDEIARFKRLNGWPGVATASAE
jgi:hypothetical protein